MHRFRAWGLSAALAAGAGASATAADPPPAPRAARPPTTLAAKLFGPKPPAPGPSAAPPAAAPVPMSPEALGEALRLEREAYLRRASVCDELRRVGVERNDDALIRRADEIERQAATVYNQRVAALGVPRVKIPLPEATPADVLDRKLGTGVAVNPLTAPAAPTALDSTAVRTAEARVPAAPAPQTGTVREVKP